MTGYSSASIFNLAVVHRSIILLQWRATIFFCNEVFWFKSSSWVIWLASPLVQACRSFWLFDFYAISLSFGFSMSQPRNSFSILIMRVTLSSCIIGALCYVGEWYLLECHLRHLLLQWEFKFPARLYVSCSCAWSWSWSTTCTLTKLTWLDLQWLARDQENGGDFLPHKRLTFNPLLTSKYLKTSHITIMIGSSQLHVFFLNT